MNAVAIAALAWIRAQGIYIALHILGIVIAFFGGALLGTEGEAISASGIALLFSLFSCGFAIVFGMPAMVGYIVVAYLTAESAARGRLLMPVMLGLGLAATVAALALGFDVAKDEFGDMGELKLLFGGLAMVSMCLAVFSLRRHIRELQNALRGASEIAHEPPEENPADNTTTVFP